MLDSSKSLSIPQTLPGAPTSGTPSLLTRIENGEFDVLAKWLAAHPTLSTCAHDEMVRFRTACVESEVSVYALGKMLGCTDHFLRTTHKKAVHAVPAPRGAGTLFSKAEFQALKDRAPTTGKTVKAARKPVKQSPKKASKRMKKPTKGPVAADVRHALPKTPAPHVIFIADGVHVDRDVDPTRITGILSAIFG